MVLFLVDEHQIDKCIPVSLQSCGVGRLLPLPVCLYQDCSCLRQTLVAFTDTETNSPWTADSG
jgi:hypothetical protein